MIWIVISIVPFGILIIETGMNVFWATVGIPVIASPFLTPLFCTITWSKATGSGVISGTYRFKKRKTGERMKLE